MKKIVSAVISLLMILQFSLPQAAFAQENGSVVNETVAPAAVDQTVEKNAEPEQPEQAAATEGQLKKVTEPAAILPEASEKV